MSTCKHKIIAEKRVGNRVAYLKQQEDCRYTINSGSIFDSGYDSWFSMEATNEKQARNYFDDYLNIWLSNLDPEEKYDEYSKNDFYDLDNEERKTYY